MNIFITGHRGRIGRDIIGLFDGYKVTTYDLLEGEDTRDIECLRAKMPDDIDILFHLANIPHPKTKIPISDYISVNIDGTENVISVAKEKGVKLFVFFSSLAAIGWDVPLKDKNFVDALESLTGDEEYPSGEPPWDESISPLPTNDMELEKYGVSKSIQEGMILESDLSYLILRLGPYGEPVEGRCDYYNDAVSEEQTKPLVSKILDGKVMIRQILHVCRIGMFGGKETDKIINEVCR